MHALEGRQKIKIENRALAPDLSIVEALRKAQKNIKSGDVVMYWLRDVDVAALGN
jgi:hypothetical protein